MKIQTISIVTAATILLVGCGKQSGSSGTASAPAKEQSSAESAATAADALRVSPSPLELVLSDDHVVFTTATNISMEMIFRNVGETNMSPYNLLVGLSVVLDGKEFQRDPKRFVAYNGVLFFQPKLGWRSRISFSDYLIPPEVLAFGRHKVAVRDAAAESNTQTIFIEPQK
jgi:hypothetical protein